ncbi:MAG TPA: carbon monoxide dehydrogenase subunit G [Chloroflexota bacterium]|jgi:hypothetical protein
MNFSGDVLLHAAPEAVWAALLDPSSLQHCLPGCQSLEPIGPDHYEATVTLGIAAVKGSYKGRVQITDKQEPTSYVLQVEGAGSSGTVKGTGSMVLTPSPDGTSVHWSADAQIGGPIASVGQRLVGGVAKLIAGDFFKCMDRHLAENGAAVEKRA